MNRDIDATVNRDDKYTCSSTSMSISSHAHGACSFFDPCSRDAATQAESLEAALHAFTPKQHGVVSLVPFFVPFALFFLFSLYSPGFSLEMPAIRTENLARRSASITAGRPRSACTSPTTACGADACSDPCD